MFLIIVSEFLLFAAFVLLLITSLSAPVIDVIGFLNVRYVSLALGKQVLRFGAWGACQTEGQNRCTGRSVGYALSDILIASIGSDTSDSLNRITKVNILFPVACGLAFIAMLVALGSKKLGFFFSSFMSIFAFLVSLAAMAVAFAVYGKAKHDANDVNGVEAEYGSAMWMSLVATICLFLAVFSTFFQCCCGSRRTPIQKTPPY